MAVSFIGYHGAAATSVATTNQVGDLLLVFAYRSGSTTAPTRPGTYSAVDTGTQASSGGAGSTNVATACGWRIATASNEGSGTWTNATAVAVLVFRGTGANPIGNVARIGASATASLIRYPAVTRLASTSWYAMFGSRLASSANATVATAPNDGTTAMTNRGSTPATPYLAAHAADSAGDWSQTDVSQSGTAAKYVAWVIEVEEPLAATVAADGGALTITDTEATLRRGRVLAAAGGALTLTGQAAALRLARRVAADAGALALTGQAATLAYGRRVGAAGGTLTLTGAAADLLLVTGGFAQNRLTETSVQRLTEDGRPRWTEGTAPTLAYSIAANAGAVTLTGQAATFPCGRRLTADPGALTLTGFSATLTLGTPNRVLQADPGTLTLTGVAATLRRGRTIVAEAGTLTLTGAQVQLRRGRTLAAAGGTLTLTGQAATLARGRRLTADAGTLTLTGSPADLRLARRVLAAGGTLTLTGGAATLVRGRRLAADPGAITLTGFAATLTASTATPRGTVTLRAIPKTLNRLTVSRTLTLTSIPRTLRGREP